MGMFIAGLPHRHFVAVAAWSAYDSNRTYNLDDKDDE